MEKIEYRACIKIRALLGVLAQAITNELVLVHGDQAPKYSTVAKWAALFKDGRESLEDDPRSGRPQTTYTAENIEQVRAIIEENPHATHNIIEALTSINHFTINEIIHNALKKRKLASRWVPHELTDQNRKFLHDNARPHVTQTVTDCLNQAGITISRHPPYSPDLAPSDFWLFDLIKKNLDDFTDVESQKKHITKLLRSIPKEEYKKTFDKWLERMQLCIDNHGHYFEHLIK